MATTNHTPTIELSQYASTDKTSYLVNYNDDMLKIDSAIAADRDNITTAQSTADTAEGKADTNKLAIDALESEVNDPSTGLAAQVAGNSSAINTINSLIGNGEPTTQDKTIIGAINELASEIPSGDVDASDVSYDNTSSGLTATDVQSAIDELANGGGVSADGVGYDNTTSGLTATNVQDAIDEIASGAIASYSTTEHVVGKWVDSTTDVYEKTYIASGQNLSATTIIDSLFTSSSVALIIDFKGAWKSTGGSWSAFDRAYSTAAENWGVDVISTGLRVVTSSTASGNHMESYVITVRYTKPSA